MSESTAPPPRQHPGWVYFIQGGPNIKIGHSSDPKKRLARLATATPEKLELLGAIEGSMAVESRLHAAFSYARIRREWFRATPWLKALADWAAKGAPALHAAELLAHAECALAARDRAIEEERAARDEAEARLVAAERIAKAAKQQADAVDHMWTYKVAQVVMDRMRELRQEFYRAKDQTDDHESFADVMETEVRSCVADVLHAVGRCSCGYSFNEHGEAYADRNGRCGARGS